MSLLALLSWIITAGGGMYLLAVWLIEYDKDFHAVAATRLPPPVLASHVVLAGGGLLLWAGYLVYDTDDLAWIAVAAILVAATLGIVMAIRWISVYRAALARTQVALLGQRGGQHGRVAVLERPIREGPPERNFPLPVVIAHGAFAALTLTLVLLTAFGVGGS
jgi:hypothetical protein